VNGAIIMSQQTLNVLLLGGFLIVLINLVVFSYFFTKPLSRSRILNHTLVSIVGLAAITLASVISPLRNPVLLSSSVRSVLNADHLNQLLTTSQSKHQLFGFPEAVANDGTPGPESSPQTKNDFVDTNVQVQGVQEGDVIKTDGDFIYYAPRWGNTIRVMALLEDDTLDLVQTITLTANNHLVYTDSLYLTTDYLIVIGYRYDVYQMSGCAATDENGDTVFCEGFAWWQPTGSVVMINRTTYSIDYTLETNSAFLDHRVVPSYNSQDALIGQTLFLVGHHYLPYQSEEDIRPYFVENNEEKRSLPYNQMYYFEDSYHDAMTTFVGIPLHDNQSEFSYQASAYLGAIPDYKKIYVTPDHLYLGQSNYYWSNTEGYQTTTIAKFAFDRLTGAVIFQAVGHVYGTAVNQFAMDEYAGYFRITTTENRWQQVDNEFISTVTNRLYVLQDDSLGGFVVIGLIDEGIGKPGESIVSSRFAGPLAYIVTFLRTDPLYIIDLSNPSAPTIRAEIILPGFDTYQHPWGDDHLIGLGYQGEDDGTITGIKLTAYDVDVDDAAEIQTLEINSLIQALVPAPVDQIWQYAYAEALFDHKAILVSPERGIFAFAVNVASGGYRSASTTTPNGDDTSSEPDSGENEYYSSFHSFYFIFMIDFSQSNPIGLPLIIEHPTSTYDYVQVDRGVMINNVVHTFSSRQVISYDVLEQTTIQTLVFPKDRD
jgi:hypothetical protein